jgi:DNA-binding MarR family transcriptional regulator
MAKRDAPLQGDDFVKMRLDRQLCFSLYAASNILTRLYRPVLAELGLTYPQYLVMLLLWEESPQGVGLLGERLYLDSSTLTPLLKRMESAGFVARRRDTRDERRVLVELTEKGRSLRAKASKVPETMARGLSIPEAELVTLHKSICKLVAEMVELAPVSEVKA